MQTFLYFLLKAYIIGINCTSGGIMKIQDQTFINKIKLLDSLDEKEKETVIDAMLTKKKMLNLLTEKHEHA
jgi:hypothetical protein